MKISDLIEQFIKDSIDENGQAWLSRGEVASKFNVVPSQINYVISSRFTQEQGYLVESRRGTGGYISVRRIDMDNSTFLMHIINSIGSSISQHTASVFENNMRENGLITKQQFEMISSATNAKCLCALQGIGDNIRAEILKNMLASILL